MFPFIESPFPFRPLFLLTGISALFAVLFLFLFLLIVSSLKAKSEHSLIPSGLPWMGKPASNFFKSLRTNFRGLIDSVRLYKEGYRKVCTYIS